MPELSLQPHRPASLAITQEGGQRFILEAVKALFDVLAAPGKLIFVLDDAQWCDEGTLKALNFLLESGFFSLASRKPGHSGNRLIIIYRLQESSPGLINTLEQWKRTKNAHTILLGRLSYQDCRTLIASLLGNEPGRNPVEQIVEPLYKVTNGNPLFMLETLRSSLLTLLNSPHSTDAPIPLPKSIQALVTRRVTLLPKDLRLVLVSAAVIGREFTVRELERVVDLSPEELVSALEGLEQENFLVSSKELEKNRAEPGYQFSHDRIRESILANISPARQRQLSLRIVRMLQEDQHKPDGESAFRIAEFFETAGEHLSAFRAWLEAAAYAQNIFDPSSAYAAWTRAEGILKHHPDLIGEEGVHHLYQDWGELASQIFDLQVMEDVYQRLQSIGEQRQSYLLRGTACTGLASVRELQSNLDEGIRLAQKAIALLEYCENIVERGRAFNILGILKRRKVLYPEAVDAFRSGLLHLSAEKSSVTLPILNRIEYNLAITLMLMGELHQSWEALVKCQEHSNLHGNPVMSANIYLIKTALLYYSGEYSAALALAEDGLDFTERTRQMRMHGYLHVFTSKLHLTLGKLDAAWEDACEAVRLGSAVNYHTVTAFGFSQQGQVLSMLGDNQGAIQKFEEGLKVSQHDNLPFLENLSGLGSSKALAGNLPEGFRHLDAALASAQEYGTGLGLVETLFRKMVVEFICGKTETAMRTLAAIRAEAIRRGYTGIDLHARMFEYRAKFAGAQSIKELEELLQALRDTPEGIVFWVDIAKAVMIAQTEQQLGKNAESALERLTKLMQSLQENCQSATLRPLYPQYRAKIIGGIKI